MSRRWSGFKSEKTDVTEESTSWEERLYFWTTLYEKWGIENLKFTWHTQVNRHRVKEMRFLD